MPRSRLRLHVAPRPHPARHHRHRPRAGARGPDPRRRPPPRRAPARGRADPRLRRRPALASRGVRRAVAPRAPDQAGQPRLLRAGAHPPRRRGDLRSAARPRAARGARPDRRAHDPDGHRARADRLRADAGGGRAGATSSAPTWSSTAAWSRRPATAASHARTRTCWRRSRSASFRPGRPTTIPPRWPASTRTWSPRFGRATVPGRSGSSTPTSPRGCAGCRSRRMTRVTWSHRRPPSGPALRGALRDDRDRAGARPRRHVAADRRRRADRDRRRRARRDRPRHPHAQGRHPLGARAGPRRCARRRRLPALLLRGGRRNRRGGRHGRGAGQRPRVRGPVRPGAARRAPDAALGDRHSARDRRGGAARPGRRRLGRASTRRAWRSRWARVPPTASTR